VEIVVAAGVVEVPVVDVWPAGVVVVVVVVGVVWVGVVVVVAGVVVVVVVAGVVVVAVVPVVVLEELVVAPDGVVDCPALELGAPEAEASAAAVAGAITAATIESTQTTRATDTGQARWAGRTGQIRRTTGLGTVVPARLPSPLMRSVSLTTSERASMLFRAGIESGSRC
jgi:hypothetical protein